MATEAASTHSAILILLVVEIGGDFMSSYYRLYLPEKLWEIEQMIK